MRCIYKHRVGLVILLGLVIRGFGIARPLLGNFSSRATANAMIAKNFLTSGYDFFHPRINIIINGKPAIDLIDFPFLSYLVAFLYKFFGFSIDFWGRITAVFFSGASMVLLYLLVKKFFDKKHAFFSLLFFILSPLSIVIGQSFQSDMPALFFSIALIYSFSEWLDKERFSMFLLSLISGSLVLLLKPQNIYLFLPLLFLLYYKYKLCFLRKWEIWMLGLFMFLPSVFWNYHAYKLSLKYDNVIGTLYRSIGSESFPSPLLLSPLFYKTLFDSLAGIVLTPFGFTLVFLGFLTKFQERRQRMFFFWFSAILIYFLIIPRKIMDLNYYLLPILPPAGVFAAKFLRVFLLKSVSQLFLLEKPISKLALFIFVLGTSMRYAWNPAFVTPLEDRAVVRAGKMVQKLTPKEAKVIAAHGTSWDFLYYCDRYGWEFEINREELASQLKDNSLNKYPDPISWLEKLRREGAEYFATVDMEKLNRHKNFKNYLYSNYKLILKDEEFVIFDLRRKI